MDDDEMTLEQRRNLIIEHLGGTWMTAAEIIEAMGGAEFVNQLFGRTNALMAVSQVLKGAEGIEKRKVRNTNRYRLSLDDNKKHLLPTLPSRALGNPNEVGIYVEERNVTLEDFDFQGQDWEIHFRPSREQDAMIFVKTNNSRVFVPIAAYGPSKLMLDDEIPDWNPRFSFTDVIALRILTHLEGNKYRERIFHLAGHDMVPTASSCS